MATLFLVSDPGVSLTFDNVDTERFGPSVSVTRHPVEIGAEVSDHSQRQPSSDFVRGRVAELGVGQPTPAALQLALDFFEQVSGQAVTYISSRLGFFPNRVITAWGHTVTPLSELVFEVSLQEVRFGASVAVPIPPLQPAPAAQTGSASTQDAGQQAPPPAELPTSFAQTVLSIDPRAIF